MVQGEEKGLSWETARVVFGRLIGIDKNANEVTVETRGEDGELFEEDYDLLGDFDGDQFEELVDYLDLDIRVVLLDNIVVRIVRNERQTVWAGE